MMSVSPSQGENDLPQTDEVIILDEEDDSEGNAAARWKAKPAATKPLRRKLLPKGQSPLHRMSHRSKHGNDQMQLLRDSADHIGMLGCGAGDPFRTLPASTNHETDFLAHHCKLCF